MKISSAEQWYMDFNNDSLWSPILSTVIPVIKIITVVSDIENKTRKLEVP